MVKSVAADTTAVQESVAVCGDVPNATLAGRVQVRPEGVEEDMARFTVPVNPLRAVTVMVDVPDEPELMLEGETGPADMLKSVTWKSTSPVTWVADVPAPVTVTV
jgi:hypothetical protein